MQVYPFWLFDAAPVDPLALPIFTPLSGFSTISAPELTVEMQDIREANWYFDSHVVKGGSVGNVVLTRAARWWDSDFYRWTMSALMGDVGSVLPEQVNTGDVSSSGQKRLGGMTPRRDLLLIHFLAHSPFEDPRITATAAAAGLLATEAAFGSPLGGVIQGGLLAANISAGQPFEFAPRIPGRAWMLYGCLPTRYRSGSDFDASSSEVSIQEIELAVERFDEISLTSV